MIQILVEHKDFTAITFFSSRHNADAFMAQMIGENLNANEIDSLAVLDVVSKKLRSE